ncbi:hypothetical protein M3557_07485 [Bhargavaea ginsengi]|uniref:hypothetical protein n=1 Tax=Bhargavaea ginsengi TaxID=426757 RepID=UPI00203E5C7F|nr:hypothetical protein [Bhargavaea ginsengi]MCM3087755.1 hypothetical protein [Bhargavaea ginsengi]
MLWKRDKAKEEAAEAKEAAIRAAEEAANEPQRIYWQGEPPKGEATITAHVEIDSDGKQFIAKVLAIGYDNGDTRLKTEFPVSTAKTEQQAFYAAKRYVEAFAADNEMFIDGEITTNVRLPIVRVRNIRRR